MEILRPGNKPLSMNEGQMTSLIHSAPVDVQIGGRGQGKTFKRAWRYHRIIESMPRSCNMIVTNTYKSLLQNTLSPLCEALEKLGYYQDYHYVIGRRPPKDWGDPAPHAPKSFENYMSFRKNGVGWRFNSQDIVGGGRSISVDSIDADEALLLDKGKFEANASATNRGNKRKWIGNPLKHGISITSSMPITAAGQWVLDFGKYYEEDGKNYWTIWNKIVRMQNEFLEERDRTKRSQMIREWEDLRKLIVFYKSAPKQQHDKPVLFTFGNCFDNISNLGIEYILDQKKIMTPLSFRIEMLNEKITSSDDCFYPIDENYNLYEMWNNSLLQGLEYDFKKLQDLDSRQDGDVDTNKPLLMAIDYGHFINAMRVAQLHDVNPWGVKQLNLRYVKSMFVKPPFGLEKLIDKFCDYYSCHNKKYIKLYYDHTHFGGEGWRKPFIDDTVKLLKARGWYTETIYLGKAPDHKEKYALFYKLLTNRDTKMPGMFLNRENDKDGILSMQLTPVKRGKKDIEKDKSSERSKVIPREQATDFSDAGDTLGWGVFRHLQRSGMELDIVT